MIFLAISSLMATRDSLTFTINPAESGDNSHVSADDEPEIFKMLLHLGVPAYFLYRVFLAHNGKTQWHHFQTPHTVRN